MSAQINRLGQPIGFSVDGWTPRPRPPSTPMEGRFCRVEPLDAERHAADLFDAYSADREWPRIRAAFERWLDPANFDRQGKQRESLSALTRV